MTLPNVRHIPPRTYMPPRVVYPSGTAESWDASPVPETWAQVDSGTHEFGTDAAERLVSRCIEQISQDYMLRDGGDVRAFLVENPSLTSLLLEAIPHISAVFGDDSEVVLQLITDPEHSTKHVILFANILTSLSAEEALVLLDVFDEQWFLDHIHRARGRLTFSLEFK